MNVNRIISILFIIPLFCFSQVSKGKKEDAYFILEKNHPDYVISPSGGDLADKSSFLKIDLFELFDRKEYESVHKDIKKQNRSSNKLNSLAFEVINRESMIMPSCNLLNMNVVNYKWLNRNSWKENNPNVLFKDLFFLLKISDNKYIKYKVGRVVIVY